ncbi:MAG: methyltransferase domain-containing protein [Bacteroidota bacterium]
MSRYHSYLNSAVEMLKQYDGSGPFSSFQKRFFSAKKKYGSKDRKEISHLCYCYFRLGKAAIDLRVEERILAGLFLCSSGSNDILQNLKAEWNELVEFPLEKKLLIIDFSLLIPEIFPWNDELSDGIDHEKFCSSFLIQPDLFLRLRPGYENIVKEKLSASAIDFREINPSCLALPNTSKVDDIIELDKEAVVQDYNSQGVGEFFPPTIDSSPLTVWDCCAGSGGKSIMAYDINPDIELTVSDIRESILSNLKKRFTKAGIKRYNSFITDLTRTTLNLKPYTFNLILCDAPCSGSGTWNRTPEQLYFFDENKIQEYSLLQKKILSNVISQLAPGGYLVYITCSVFKKENEDIVDFLKQEFHLDCIKMELLKGYEIKADSMFVALLRKTL